MSQNVNTRLTITLTKNLERENCHSFSFPSSFYGGSGGLISNSRRNLRSGADNLRHDNK